jgi:hypothetical protein
MESKKKIVLILFIGYFETKAEHEIVNKERL